MLQEKPSPTHAIRQIGYCFIRTRFVYETDSRTLTPLHVVIGQVCGGKKVSSFFGGYTTTVIFFFPCDAFQERLFEHVYCYPHVKMMSPN